MPQRAFVAAEQHQEARDATVRLRLVLEHAEALLAPDPEPRAVNLEVLSPAGGEGAVRGREGEPDDGVTEVLAAGGATKEGLAAASTEE